MGTIDADKAIVDHRRVRESFLLSISHIAVDLMQRFDRTRLTLLPGLLVSAICVFYQSLYRAIPANGDLLLALPIGKEFAHPGLYSKYDLLISSGVRGPYHLYKYLGGFLYRFNSNIDPLWEIFFLVFLFLTFLAFWFLSFELTSDTITSALVLAMITVAHPLRGSLHASAVPVQSFVTALAAMPFAIMAIVLLLRNRFFIAMALSGISFNIHPYIGVLIISATASAIAISSKEPFGKRLVTIFGGGLFCLPNVFYILTHLPTNFGAVSFDYFAQFRLYAMHAFVDEHWREGYGWFFMNLAGAIFFARYIDKRKRRVVSILFLCWFGSMAVYVFNSYVTENIPILLMFLFRATYFIKPIVFVFVIHGLQRWRHEIRNVEKTRQWWMPWELSAAVVVLFISAILPMEFAVTADVLALVAYGFLALKMGECSNSHRVYMKSIFFIGVFLLLVVELSRIAGLAPYRLVIDSIIVGVIVALAITLIPLYDKLSQRIELQRYIPNANLPTRRIVLATVCILLSHHLIISVKNRQLPMMFDIAGIESRIAMQQAPPRTAALVQWARLSTPQGALFVVPPDNWEDFGAFRLAAERGVYATIMEVNQLAFDASVYNEMHQRLINLGIKSSGNRDFDQTGYYELTSKDLLKLGKKEHADYIVFERKQLHGYLSSIPSVYQDTNYVVASLRPFEAGIRGQW